MSLHRVYVLPSFETKSTAAATPIAYGDAPVSSEPISVVTEVWWAEDWAGA